MRYFSELFEEQLGSSYLLEYHELVDGYNIMTSGQRIYYSPLELLCSRMDEYVRLTVREHFPSSKRLKEDALDVSWALNHGILSTFPGFVDDLWEDLEDASTKEMQARIEEFMLELLQIFKHVLDDSTPLKAEFLFHLVRNAREALEGQRTDALREARLLCDELWRSGYGSSDVDAFLRSILAVDLLHNEIEKVSALAEELQAAREARDVEELWEELAR